MVDLLTTTCFYKQSFMGTHPCLFIYIYSWLLSCYKGRDEYLQKKLLLSQLLLSHVQLFVTPWTAARQASLSITNSQSLLKLMCIKSVMPSNLCRPLLILPSVFPSIRIFSNESALCIRWPKSIGVSASASVLPVNIQD